MSSEYIHENYYDKDTARHEAALAAARKAGMLNGYSGFEEAVSPCGVIRVSKRIVVRAPVASRQNVWNLSMPVVQVAEDHALAGRQVYLIFGDLERGILKEVEYRKAIAEAVKASGKGREPDYYQINGDAL